MPDSPLRRGRRKHCLSQTEVAQEIGVTPATVALWESAECQGSRPPTGRALIRLVWLTHLPAEALLRPEQYLTRHPGCLRQYAPKPVTVRRG